MKQHEVNKTYLDRAAAMFSAVKGKPCVNVDAKTGKVHFCNRLHKLRIDDDLLEGTCKWQDSAEDRPDELTDEIAIGSDLLDVGDGWWLDMYFDWYLVFTPEFVRLSSTGDHSWVPEFLRSTIRNRTIPRPPPSEDAIDLLPDAEALRYFG